MMAFWIGTALLLVVSCILIVYPLLNPKEIDEATQRDDLNKAFYKDRLAELESEDQAGIVGNKSDLVTDLKQLLLDDIPDSKSDAKVSAEKVKWMTIPVILFMIILSYGMYAMYGAQDKVSHWTNVASNLPELSKKLMNPNGVQLTDQEMNDLTLGL
ncbi:MAG: c-type cytochrome biogenesis protein CcmI, partial [Vibrio casei]